MVDFFLHNTIFSLFLLLFISIVIGTFSWRGFSLGMSAVLFVALFFGYFGLRIPQELTNLGLALFAYSIGLQVGRGFFRALRENGKHIVLICAIGTIVSGAATFFVGKLFHIHADIASGLFAGSNTNTPVLAAATEFATKLGMNAGNISVGYGISYPLTAIVILLIVQFAPIVYKKRASVALEEWHDQINREPLVIKTFRAINPASFGKKLSDIHMLHYGKVNISRIIRNEHFIPATADAEINEKDIIVAVGLADSVKRIGLMLGKEEDVAIKDKRYQVIDHEMNVFSSDFVGKSLDELEVWKKYNVVITRIKKNGFDLVPQDSYELENGDRIVAVGRPDDISLFSKHVSAIDAKTNEVNYIAFFLGLSLGILIGLVPINFFGIDITLGMSTGVFLVSLIMGYNGKIGNIKTFVPVAASNLSRDLGLMLFLAGAGTSAGMSIVPVLQTQGVSIIYASVLICFFSTIVPFFLMLYFLKIDFYSILGAFGGFTASPSALAAAKSKININIAMVSYAVSFPFSLIFKVIFVQLLMIFLQYLH